MYPEGASDPRNVRRKGLLRSGGTAVTEWSRRAEPLKTVQLICHQSASTGFASPRAGRRLAWRRNL